MNPVNMLIYNALAQHRSLILPDIGSLYVTTASAQMQADGRLSPPACQVHFSAEEVPHAENMLALISRSSGKDPEQSRAIYQAWLSEVSSEQQTTIPSVGMIRDGIFIPTPDFNHMLNPAGTRPVPAGKAPSRNIFFWILTVIVIGGGLAAGVTTWLDSRPDRYPPLTKQTPLAPAPAQAPADSLTEEGAEPAAVQPAQAKQEASPAPKPAAVQPAKPQPATAPKEAKAAPKTEPAPKPASAQPQTPSVTSQAQAGRYYLVVGVYSTPENAEKFIATSRAKGATETFHKLDRPGGKVFVYIAEESDSRRAAELMRQATAGLYPDAWLYKR